MFNMHTLYLLTMLNISIQTIDCNNLQNSYVLRILCFWGESDWLGGVGGGCTNACGFVLIWMVQMIILVGYRPYFST